MYVITLYNCIENTLLGLYCNHILEAHRIVGITPNTSNRQMIGSTGLYVIMARIKSQFLRKNVIFGKVRHVEIAL